MFETLKEKLPSFVDRHRSVLNRRLCSLFARAAARSRAIQVGHGCEFYGVPILRRAPFSAVHIGPRCQFRSCPTSNLVGLNRPCYVCTLRPRAVITIGSGCGFSATVISAAERIEIGNNVLCGANTTITDCDWHHMDAGLRLAGDPGAAAPVIIEDCVWLGLNVTVLKGVRIGYASVVAAGSVVVKDVPPNCVVAGVPARIIRSERSLMSPRDICM